jgi:hypothetical protein
MSSNDTTTAEIEVVCPGMLSVLSVGKGDLRLTVGGDDPDEIEKGRKVIEEMLRAGYGIFVETDKGLTRVKRFNPKRMTYVITEIVDEPPKPMESVAPAEPAKPVHPNGRRRHRTTEREVPVAGSRATAIGRTAGG